MSRADTHRPIPPGRFGARVDYPPGNKFDELIETQARRTRGCRGVRVSGTATDFLRVECAPGNYEPPAVAGRLPVARIGIGMERWPEQVVALLSILNAGGAYVPLEPAYPREQLDFMLADSHVPILLEDAQKLAAKPKATRLEGCGR